MIDRPGPWGTGPFTLTEGYSSISTRCAIQRAEPFACSWLIESEDRSAELVLEANRDHWNTERMARIERVVFRNDLSPGEALDLCLSGDGELDIVTEVSPADAERVERSEFADLVVADANRVMVGVLNLADPAVPLTDQRVRQALNLAVDTRRIIDEAMLGHANPLAALTPAWTKGVPEGQEPYPHDPGRAKALLEEAGGWPAGRPLRIAAPPGTGGVARMIAADLHEGLGLEAEVIDVPGEQMLAGARALIEKKLTPPWDMLIHAWFDLSSEAPPAAVHREFFGSDGAFRTGPEIPGFDRLYAEMIAQTDGGKLVEVAERIDAWVYDQALALFLCAPKALYAVNKHVTFGPYRTTFELAEATVDEGHWSRRNGG